MDPREVVRIGYNRVSHAYRGDEFPYSGSDYERWLSSLAPKLRPGARVLDLGCGCGIPVSRVLAANFKVTGVDFSQVQIDRGRGLVPEALFLCADMTEVEFAPSSFEAVVCLFAIIHVPLDAQIPLIGRISKWLSPGGHFLVTVGHTAWTGTEADWRGVSGATMWWSHADVATYRRWLEEAGFEILGEDFTPEGDGGHTTFLAKSGRAGEPTS